MNTGGLFRLSARVLTPTPDDDSFFVSIRSGTGTDLFPEIAWSPGVFKTWVWSDVTVPGKRDTATFELPKGNAILTLRPREAGAKIDQFRLTPISRR